MPAIVELFGLGFGVMAVIIFSKWIVLATPVGRWVPGAANAIGTV